MTGKDVLARLEECPWLWAAALALGSFLLFCWNIALPGHIYFDETHYVPAARILLALDGPTNIEHPLVGKELIAAGIALFGDNPWGWRLPSALLGAVAVAAFFRIALLLLRDPRAALFAALLMVFNQTHFIQARIAMLEMPMTAGLLVGLACLLEARESEAHARRWQIGAAVALGLAVGAKWLAIPYVALFLGASAWRKWHEGKEARQTGGEARFQLIDRMATEAVLVGGIAVLVYLLTFLPAFFYRNDPMTLAGFFGFQLQMLDTQRGHMAAHPYQSVWWQWMLMLRPIWYLFETDQGHYRAVLLIGNPLIYWGGLAAFAALASGWIGKRSFAVLAAIGLYAFSVAVWILIPKEVEFFYYYNLSGIWLCLVIGAFFLSFGKRGREWLGWFTLASAVMFAHFYPIIAASALPTDNTWTQWVWMKSWF